MSTSSSSTIVDPQIAGSLPTNNRRQRDQDQTEVEEGGRKRLKFSDADCEVEEGDRSPPRRSSEVHHENDEHILRVEADLMKYVLWVDMISDAHELFFDQRGRFNNRA